MLQIQRNRRQYYSEAGAIGDLAEGLKQVEEAINLLPNNTL